MAYSGSYGPRTELTKWSTASQSTGRVVLLAIALASCSAPDNPVIDVDAIGGAARLADPDRVTLTGPDRVLLDATAMGLVAIDARGQVEPALAESWIVTDDGLSTIFRIRRLKWPDGREATSEEVAASLNRALAESSRNRLRPLLSAVEAVVSMTGRVVEVRLRVPRPQLLQLLAQPELGVRRDGMGLGPWRIANTNHGLISLKPAAPDEDSIDPDNPPPKEEREIKLSSLRAALAIARFDAGLSRLVLGGTLADWPILQAAQLPANRIRVDPAEGLLGLAAMPSSDFMRQSALRDALSKAIDREALADTYGVPRWRLADRLLPARLDSALVPAAPSWAGTSLNDRRQAARAQISEWTRARGPLLPLKVALPSGPGMRVLFAHIAADWRTIGVSAVAVPMAAKDADFRLIDEVAPNTSANWYLTRTSCDYGLACEPTAETALKASRAASSYAVRANAISEADAAQANAATYIPLGRPVRWSLVDPALGGFNENAFAAHPLAELVIRAE